MTPRTLIRLLTGLLLTAPVAGLAQNVPSVSERGREATAGSHDALAHPRLMWEGVASSVFQSTSIVVPLWRRVAVEAHYFGVPGGERRSDVLQTGVSWHVALGHVGSVAPGVGWYSGVDHGAVSGSLRWQIEHGRIVSEGLIVQAFDQKDGSERGQFWDGNHVSLSFLDGRLEVGPSWEHIHLREEDEWKWGSRVAVRLAPHVTAQLFTLTPGRTEWRAGLLVR